MKPRGPHGQLSVRGVEYRRVYVWELPVRAYHWINAIALVTLCVTGYLIGAPIRMFYAAEAYQQYWFGWVRFIHFVAAYVYVFNFLARLYWGFTGNKYAKWTAFSIQEVAAAGDCRRHPGRCVGNQAAWANLDRP